MFESILDACCCSDHPWVFPVRFEAVLYMPVPNRFNSLYARFLIRFSTFLLSLLLLLSFTIHIIIHTITHHEKLSFIIHSASSLPDSSQLTKWPRQRWDHWNLWWGQMQLLHLLQSRGGELADLRMSHQLRRTHQLRGEMHGRSAAPGWSCAWPLEKKILGEGNHWQPLSCCTLLAVSFSKDVDNVIFKHARDLFRNPLVETCGHLALQKSPALTERFILNHAPKCADLWWPWHLDMTQQMYSHGRAQQVSHHGNLG